MCHNKAPKGAVKEKRMKISGFGVSMLIAFTVLLVAKVMELGIGATLSWWIVLLPIYGPLALVLTIIAVVFALASLGIIGSAALELFRKKK